MTATKRYLPISVFCLLIGSISSAMAGSSSALDPYAMVQAPTAKEAEERVNKARAKKGLPPITKSATTKKNESALGDLGSSTTTTYVTAPGGGKGKAVKDKVVPSTTRVAAVAPSPETKEPAAPAGGGGGGVMDGIKTISEGYSKTFKAATHGAVSATKASCGVVVSGSKKVGSGIVGGAKASGDALAKSASFVGAGFKTTGEKLKESTGGIGEKMSAIPEMIGHGFKTTGDKVKEGTGKIAGAIPNPFHKDKGESVVKQAKIASKPKAEPVKQEIKDDLQDEMIDSAKPIAVAPKKETLVGEEEPVSKPAPAAATTAAAPAPVQPGHGGIKAKLASLTAPVKSMGKMKIKLPFVGQKNKDVANSKAVKPTF